MKDLWLMRLISKPFDQAWWTVNFFHEADNAGGAASVCVENLIKN